MTPAERAEILFTARLLRAAGRIDWLATGLTLLAAATIVFASGNRLFAMVAVALGLIAKYYAVRIELDAHMLEDIESERLSTTARPDHRGQTAAGEPGAC